MNFSSQSFPDGWRRTVKRASWSRVAVEGVVIVVSILLALGLEAAWAERQDRASEREVLLALDVEIGKNLEQLTVWVTNIERRQRSYLWFMERSPTEVGAVDEDMRAALIDGIWNLAFFQAEAGVLNSLVNSGRLSLIQNLDLAASLTTWPQLIAESDAQRDFNAIESSRVIAIVQANTELFSSTTPVRLRDGSVDAALPTAARSLPALRDNVLFVEQWSLFVGMEIGYRSSLQRVIAHGEELREAIATELAAR